MLKWSPVLYLSLSLLFYPNSAKCGIEAANTAEAASTKEKIAALIASTIKSGSSLMPKTWPETQVAEAMDVNVVLGIPFEDGICFGATAAETLDSPYSEIKELLAKPDGVKNLLAAVTTLKDFHYLDEKEKAVKVRMKIKVPILSDFSVEEHVTTYETADGKGVLEWNQDSEYGELNYNHGAVIAIPAGRSTQIFVLGIFQVKPENKMSWLTKGPARSFAKTHYASYIDALKKQLGSRKAPPKISI